jgi:hypothetical protein
VRRHVAAIACDGGRGECVLVGAAVELLSHELFGSRVGDRAAVMFVVVRPLTSSVLRVIPKSARRIRCSASSLASVSMMLAGLISRRSSPCLWAYSSVGDGGDDRRDLVYGHAGGIASEQPGSVDALDVVHRDPERAVVFAPVVHADDMGRPQRGGEVGFAGEARRDDKPRASLAESLLAEFPDAVVVDASVAKGRAYIAVRSSDDQVGPATYG